MNNERIKHAIEQFPLDKFPGVKSIVVGDKITNNKNINKQAVVFGVHAKIPVGDLPEGQLLPDMIQVDDEQIVTDVVQDDTDWQFEAYCPAVTDSDRDEHRMYTRPLKGGVSIGIDTEQHKQRVGTLGVIVRDLTDNQLVGLTCSHVVAPDIFTTANRQINTIYNYKDVQVLQPARGEGNSNTIYYDHVIGHVKRAWPIVTDTRSKYNMIDAAICTIDSNVGIDANSGSMTGLIDESTGAQIPTVPFATTQEIDNMTPDVPLFKSSRTTGAIGSTYHVDDVVSNNACSLRMYDGLAAGIRRVTGRYFFPTFAYHDPVGRYDPSEGGDSGSAILAWMDNMWKIVGLHFAGGRTNGVDYGLGCRIDNIANLLQVGDLTTPADFYSYGGTNPTYHVEEGYSGEMYMNINGKVYWQMGRVAEPVSTG